MNLRGQTQAIAALFAHELAGPMGATRQSLALLQKHIEASLDAKELAIWKAGLEMDLSESQSGPNGRRSSIYKMASAFRCALWGAESAIGIMKNISQFSSLRKDKTSVLQTLKVAWAIIAAQNKQATIRWHIEQLPLVMGNPHALMEVWMNILSNAIRLNKGKTSIDVCLRTKGRRALVEITNSGKALPKGRNIFAKSKRKTRKSSGIGLPLCKKIIEGHGGKISARDSESGPVFAIELGAGATQV